MAVAAFGQTERPPGFVQGVVAENTVAFFSVRTTAGDVYRYRADGKTWIERDHDRIRVASLKPGEILEVVSDRDPEPVRYARMVHVIEPVVPRRLPVSAGGVYRLNPAAPRTTGVYAGLVVTRDPERITIRTRFDGDKTVYLQTDTRCIKDGDLVDARAIVPGTRVYVVATRNEDRELIANQVVWGAILEPQW